MPEFAIGAKVRVRAGTVDPENPDLPIGRWCGVVEDVDDTTDPVSYYVTWDQRTRDNMSTQFLSRCRLEGLEIESMWLDEDQLEPDQGELIPIEKPSATTALSLNDPDPERRLLAVFGLAADAEIPDVDEVSLRLFHAHLLSHLTFPFKASFAAPFIQKLFTEVEVKRLLPVEPGKIKDGLLCEVDSGDGAGHLPVALLRADPASPQGRLLSDYVYWMEHWEPPHQIGDLPRLPLRTILGVSGVGGAVYGATLGAITAVKEQARLGMTIGAAGFAILFGLVGRRIGATVANINGNQRGPMLGWLLGLALGATFGVLLGTLAVVFLGTLTGVIVTALLTEGLPRRPGRALLRFTLVILGGCLGGVIQVLTIDPEQARLGALVGAGLGFVSGLLLVFVLLVTLVALMTRRG